MQAALNKQVNAEFYSAYLYLSMSAYFESINLKGFANWMRIQFQEETAHAAKFYDFIGERGGRVLLEAIEMPKTAWDSAIEVFEDTLKHERHVTSLIHNLVSLAQEEKDPATGSFLQWFVDEQVEEEANADEMLQQLKLIEGQGAGLFMLDREARQRVFTPPPGTVK
jgi:ferritin